MALMATTSLAAEGRGEEAMQEHQAIVDAIVQGNKADAYDRLREHISAAFITRLKLDAKTAR
jgi:DNA-binding GntR family transcriptional regulator